MNENKNKPKQKRKKRNRVKRAEKTVYAVRNETKA